MPRRGCALRGRGERPDGRHGDSIVTASSAERILIIEDEEAVAVGLGRVLESHGYGPELTFDGSDGLAKALTGEYALIVLDIMLPSTNGFKVCAQLREEGVWTPILMVSAKSGEWDQAESLDAGADDYLTKPVSMTVLLAHVRALIRRAKLFDARLLAVDGLTLDPVRHCCSDGITDVDLSAREIEVLACLMNCRDVVVPKSDLIENVWGRDFRGDANIVEVYIRHLRRKLEGPFNRKIIDTVRGSGYRFHNTN
jgi:two-component system, OmpR family, response regulator